VGIAGLSPREREVVHELKLGSTNKEIARALDMTEHTVKFHLRNIFNKLGVDRRAHVLAKVPARSSFGP
jgi:LuxR family maltose regulon positive regulatory protein